MNNLVHHFWTRYILPDTAFMKRRLSQYLRASLRSFWYCSDVTYFSSSCLPNLFRFADIIFSFSTQINIFLYCTCVCNILLKWDQLGTLFLWEELGLMSPANSYRPNWDTVNQSVNQHSCWLYTPTPIKKIPQLRNVLKRSLYLVIRVTVWKHCTI